MKSIGASRAFLRRLERGPDVQVAAHSAYVYAMLENMNLLSMKIV